VVGIRQNMNSELFNVIQTVKPVWRCWHLRLQRPQNLQRLNFAGFILGIHIF
jgi:hypothetical protein